MIPKKITPDPIHEAVVEIRFSTDIMPSAIFGMIFNLFKDEGWSSKPLPILQIPEEVRIKDPGFMFKATHQLSKENAIFAVGPRALSFSVVSKYIGWTNYRELITTKFNTIKQTGIISKVERVGLRYINFFEDVDVFDFINFEVSFSEQQKTFTQKIFRGEIADEKFTNTLQIANRMQIGIIGAAPKNGSIIDIDTSIDDTKNSKIIDEIPTVIETVHQQEKELFFSLLKSSYLSTLNPEY